MKLRNVIAIVALLGCALAALTGLSLAHLSTVQHESFALRAELMATNLTAAAQQPAMVPRAALPVGAEFCHRRVDGQLESPGSRCEWLQSTSASVSTTSAEIVIVQRPLGRYGLYLPTSPLRGELAASRALLLGGGTALFLVISGLLIVGVSNREDATVNAVTRHLEALAAGDLATRSAETGHGRQRRTMMAANAVAERLQVTVERQRTFLADAAHQLRNPLVALQLRLENLEPYVTAKGGRAHARLTQDFLRLGTTLDDLVTFARATESDGGPREVDVLGVVDERLRSWVPVAYARKIVLRQRLPDAAVALARPGALEQAIDVLVDNALKHAPSRSEITVVIVPTATYVEVRVEDRGRGLPAGAQDAAAARGWRHDPREAGNGLGLAIATLLVSSSGGSLQLRDRTDGTGLSAVVRLPTPAPVVSPALLPAGRRSTAGWHQD